MDLFLGEWTPFNATSVSRELTLCFIDLYTYVLYHSLPSVFFGTKPWYFIADLDLCKDIFVKHFDKFVDRLVSGNVPALD